VALFSIPHEGCFIVGRFSDILHDVNDVENPALSTNCSSWSSWPRIS
jgi:hypothetical protein